MYFSDLLWVVFWKKTGAANMDKEMVVNLKGAFHCGINKKHI